MDNVKKKELLLEPAHSETEWKYTGDMFGVCPFCSRASYPIWSWLVHRKVVFGKTWFWNEGLEYRVGSMGFAKVMVREHCKWICVPLRKKRKEYICSKYEHFDLLPYSRLEDIINNTFPPWQGKVRRQWLCFSTLCTTLFQAFVQKIICTSLIMV